MAQAAYVEGNVLYEDIESFEPEVDEAKVSEARRALVDLDGLVPLIALLDSPTPDVVAAATGALFNTALSPAGADALLKQSGALTGLLGGGGLKHEDARVRANAAGALMNIGAHSDDARSVLGAGGALEALVSVAAREGRPGGQLDVLARAVGALNNMVLLDGNAAALCALPPSATAAQPDAPLPARAGLGVLLELLGAISREDILEDAALCALRVLQTEPAACSELVGLKGLGAVRPLLSCEDEELHVRASQIVCECATHEPRTHRESLALGIVGALAALLASPAEEVQEAAVLAVTALFTEVAVCRAFRKADGIPALVELLPSHDEELARATLFCVGQLARFDGPSRALIRDEGGIESTVRLLTSRSTSISAAAAHVLRWAGLNEEVKRVVREAGALPTLCLLLEGGDADPTLCEAAIGALANLTLNEPDSQDAVRLGGGLERAMPLLTSELETIALLAAHLFEHCAEGSPDNREHYRLIGALRPISGLVTCSDEERRLAVVGAVMHSVHGNTPNQVRARQLGAPASLVYVLTLPPLVSDLSADGRPRPPPHAAAAVGTRAEEAMAQAASARVELQRRACWALSHIACEPLGAAAIREVGGHAPLLDLARVDGAPALVAPATSCLFNCAMNDGRASARPLIDAGALEFALRTLEGARASGSDDTAAYAAGILMNLLLFAPDEADGVAAAGGLELLMSCIGAAHAPMLNCNAAGALANASKASAAVCASLIEAGAVGSLVAILDPSASEQTAAVVDQLGALLANLFATDQGRAAGREAGAARVLAELLEDEDGLVVAVAARALSNLCVGDDENKAAATDAGALNLLLSTVARGPPDVYLDVTCHSEAQLSCSLCLLTLTPLVEAAESLIGATSEPPPPPYQVPGATAAGARGAAAAPPAGEPGAEVGGLRAALLALRLGQPYESIRAKAALAGTLANAAALAEARAFFLNDGLIPLAVDALVGASKPVTRVKAEAQAGTEQPSVADAAEMDGLVELLQAGLCALVRNLALNPPCKRTILAEPAAMSALITLARDATNALVLAHAAGALQNLQDRSEVRPGAPTNPISNGERTALKMYQLKKRLHAAGEGASAPLPDALVGVDDDTDDVGPGSRTKAAYAMLPKEKLSATHDVKESKGPFYIDPIVVTFTRQSAGCSRKQPIDKYIPVPSPLPSPPASPLPWEAPDAPDAAAAPQPEELVAAVEAAALDDSGGAGDKTPASAAGVEPIRPAAVAVAAAGGNADA